MIALVLSVLCTVVLILLFKYFGKLEIQGFHAIVVNYLVCIILGLFFTGREIITVLNTDNEWIYIPILVGSFFIWVFYLISYTARNISITVSTVAMKMSLVIPVVFGIFFLNEQFSLIKLAGVLLALVSIYLVTKIDLTHLESKISPLKTVLFPGLIFVFSGIGDVLIKSFQQFYLSDNNFNVFLVLLFGTAFILGFFALLWQLIVQKKQLEKKAIIAGIVLGGVNYFSIYFLIAALETAGMDASTLFPVNNIATVSCSAIAAVLLFREKLNAVNIVGVICAIIAIILLTPGFLK